MAPELRKTGISVVGDVAWGTHFCHFYETKQDLLDTLIPYFKVGLESKEFCLWVVSDSEIVTVEEARGALAQAVPDLDRQLADGNIEILNGHDWYLEENVFNLERVMSAWDAKLKRALARGYDGMRASADTFWLAEKDWKDFFAYEKQINEWITDQRMTVSCTYPLAKSGAAEVLDVVQTHHFAIARRQGEWEVIETPELIQAKAEIKRLNDELEQKVIERTNELRATNEKLRKEIAERGQAEGELRRQKEILQQIFDHIPVMISFVGADGRVKLVNREWERTLGWSLEEMRQQNLDIFTECYPDPQYRQEVLKFVAEAKGEWADFKTRVRDGSVIDTNFFRIRLSDGTSIGIGTDITERKQAEALLHAREQEFRAIVENAPDQIIRYDREFRRTYVNPAVAQFYGLPAETLIGKPLGSDIPKARLEVKEDEIRLVRQRIADVFNTGKIYDYELTWTMPTGRTYFAVRLFPELDLNGSVVNVLGISRDITERKQAEDVLRRSEDHLRLVLDATPALIHTGRPDGYLDYFNQRWLKYVGRSLEELQDWGWTASIHPDDVEGMVNAWRASLASGEPFQYEARVRQANGEYRWMLHRKVPLRDEHGHIVKWHGSSIDIEDRKQAEEKLLQSERQLAEAQRLAHVGSFEWDLRSNAVTWSDELFRIFRLQPGEISVAGDAIPFIHPDDRDLVQSTVKTAVATKKPYSLYYRILRTDGSERTVQSLGHIVTDEEGNPIKVYGATEDVTELKRAEEQLKATTEQLRALSARFQSAREEEGMRIAREIHDELGSALTSLKWDLEGMEKMLSDPKSGPELASMKGKAKTMTRLVDGTIDVVRRISAELRPSALDDLGLMPAIEWHAQQFQVRTGIVCDCDFPFEKAGLNQEQSTAVFRILQEALTNVLRHAQATRVSIRAAEEAGEFILTISDNGKGISEDETSGLKSLGLLGMRERAILIGGNVDIAGVEGKGTVITLKVPIGRAGRTFGAGK